MDIHIHCFIGDRDIQGAYREFTDHNAFPAGCFDRIVQDFAVHNPAVNEEKLLAPVASRVFSDTDISLYHKAVSVIIHRLHFLHSAASVHRLHRRGCLSVSRGMVFRFPV